MTQYQAQQPGSMLDIRPGFFPLAFLLYFCTPFYSINGSPPAPARWGQNPVPVPPRRDQVAVWVRYLFRPQMGLSSIVLDAAPGSATVVTWRAPFTIFGTGRIAVADVVALGGAPAVQAPQQHGGAGGWHADPTGRHQARYFDGARWTDHVVDAGVQTRDPIAS